jgi:hypothetical protein
LTVGSASELVSLESQQSGIMKMACATLKRRLDFDIGNNYPTPIKRRRRVSVCMSASAQQTKQQPSPFGEVYPKLTPETMAARIQEETRRLLRLKQLNLPPDTSSTKEKPLFTLQQVGLICERMLKERECQIREEYDRVLNTKLCEQYATFVKFTYDQI